MDKNPTIRHYPRTLIEAFPKTMEYGACIFIYPRTMSTYAVGAIVFCAALFIALIVRNVCILL